MKKSFLIKLTAFTLASFLTMGALVGCSDNTSDKNKKGDASKGKVYYLNFKPEQDKAWQKLAKKYTEETGITVKVKTAGEGTYEPTLTAEMNMDEAPTLFQVNGPVGLSKWKDFCMDLESTDIYKQLTSKDFVLKDDSGAVKSIAYVIESYGIIYNKTLLTKYCKSDFSTVKSIDEINSFDKLKTVADEIQANKEKLGVKGAFTSAGMDSSSDWRFKTHLANLPIYYEYKKDKISDTNIIKGTYLDNFKNIWDLYISDSTCKKNEIAKKTNKDAESEFISGKAVFFQNGSWEYDALKKGGLKDNELGMLPVYIGAEGEAKQGLCTGTENYWCINDNATTDDKAATEDFVKWCVTSKAGTKAMAEDMNFEIPFRTAGESANVFVKIDNKLRKAGKTPVSWCFTTMPSEDWKDSLGAAMTHYADGTGDWDAVKRSFVDEWAIEKREAEK